MASGVDLAPLQRAVRSLSAAAANTPREMGRVIVSAQRAGGTEAKRAIAGQYNVRQSRIAGDLRVQGDAAALRLSIVGTGRPLTAASFGGRQLKRGYRVQVLRAGPAVVIRRGFTQEGVAAPLMRTSKARYPIRPIYGPSTPDMLGAERVRNPLGAVLVTRLTKDVQRRLEAELKKV